MSAKKSSADHGELEHILAEARKLRTRRGNLYRDKALKILPWICAWCGREFTSKKLHEASGFVFSGRIKDAGYKFSRWLDLDFYQLLLPTPSHPQEG